MATTQCTWCSGDSSQSTATSTSCATTASTVSQTLVSSLLLLLLADCRTMCRIYSLKVLIIIVPPLHLQCHQRVDTYSLHWNKSHWSIVTVQMHITTAVAAILHLVNDSISHSTCVVSKDRWTTAAYYWLMFPVILHTDCSRLSTLPTSDSFSERCILNASLHIPRVDQVLFVCCDVWHSTVVSHREHSSNDWCAVLLFFSTQWHSFSQPLSRARAVATSWMCNSLPLLGDRWSTRDHKVNLAVCVCCINT